MAGIEYKKRKVTEATVEVPRNQDFRRRFVGDIGELLNVMCELLEKAPFSHKGSAPQHVLLGALIQAAMKHGSLDFVVDDEVYEIDISEKKLGNLAGLLMRAREWNADAGQAPAPEKPEEQPVAEAPVAPQATPVESTLSQEERDVIASYTDAEPVADQPVDAQEDQPAATMEAKAEDDEGDSKNQLHMALDDEAEEPAPAPVEVPVVPEAEVVEQPAQEKPKRAIPDFRAQMRKGEK